jgi:hypothetical protein
MSQAIVARDDDRLCAFDCVEPCRKPGQAHEFASFILKGSTSGQFARAQLTG